MVANLTSTDPWPASLIIRGAQRLIKVHITFRAPFVATFISTGRLACEKSIGDLWMVVCCFRLDSFFPLLHALTWPCLANIVQNMSPKQIN